MDLLSVTLLGAFCASWISIFVSSSRLGKFLAVFPQIFFLLLSLLSSWEPTPPCICPIYHLSYPLLSAIFFPFTFQLGCFLTTLSSRRLICSFASSSLLLISLSAFFILVTVFFNSDWFFYIFYLIFEVLSSSPPLSSSVSIFMTVTLNCLSGRLLISFPFSYFSELLSSFAWSIFLCLWFWLSCCLWLWIR